MSLGRRERIRHRGQRADRHRGDGRRPHLTVEQIGMRCAPAGGAGHQEPRSRRPDRLKELVEAGQHVPVIDGKYPLSETGTAMSHVRTGHAQGRSSAGPRDDEDRGLDPGGSETGRCQSGYGNSTRDRCGCGSLSAVLMPSCPFSFLPQQCTVRSERTAQVWPTPPSSRVTPVNSPVGRTTCTGGRRTARPREARPIVGVHG